MPINPNYIGVEQSITIEQVDYLDTIINNTNDDLFRIENNLLTEENTRFTNDQTLQTNINLKLAEANSVFKADYTKYVVDGRDNIQSVIDSITNQGTVVYLSSGSIGGSGLVIDKQNIALIAPKSTPPIFEILQETTTATTANRIRMSNIQIDGVMNAGSSRSVYTDCVFTENVNILASADAGYMTFESCSFATNKTINVANDFASVIYFINCNFIGCSFSLNQASNQQVIFSNCAGFVSFPTNAFYAGINTLTSGYIQNSITKTILSTGSGELGQVLTSGGLNGADTWTTPSGGGGGVNLETIQKVCNGDTITTKSGQSLTIPNITAVVFPNLAGGHTILASVPYQPPSGTKSVMLTLKFFIGWNGTSSSTDALFDCRVNGTSYNDGVITTRSYIRSYLSGMGDIGEYEINCLINVDSSIANDDLPNGLIKTWNTPYTFNFASSRILDTSQVWLFSNRPHPYNTALNYFIAPILIIKAFS